jgi:AraC family transcriptional activator of tynA and feaB
VCGGAQADRFRDPDFGQYEIAAELSISLRYHQKLFTKRGCTCSVIQSVRLAHAAAQYQSPGVDEIGRTFERDSLRLRVSRLH